MIWAISIAILFLLFAIWFAKVGIEIIEDSDVFLIVTGVFFLLFMGVGFALTVLIHPPASSANISGLVRSFIQPVFASNDQL